MAAQMAAWCEDFLVRHLCCGRPYTATPISIIKHFTVRSELLTAEKALKHENFFIL